MRKTLSIKRLRALYKDYAKSGKPSPLHLFAVSEFVDFVDEHKND